MSAVAVQELKEHTDEIVRRVQEERESIDVTLQGEVVARLIPIQPKIDQEELKRLFEEEDRLAEEIGRHWPAGLSAADAIAADRE